MNNFFVFGGGEVEEGRYCTKNVDADQLFLRLKHAPRDMGALSLKVWIGSDFLKSYLCLVRHSFCWLPLLCDLLNFGPV